VSNPRPPIPGATVYAYLYLFDEKNVLEPLDPRVRLAADLYNLSLAKAFVGARESFNSAAEQSLPVGTMSVTPIEAVFSGTARPTLACCRRSSSGRGLRARYRYYGLERR
jgi:hypothetical protein